MVKLRGCFIITFFYPKPSALWEKLTSRVENSLIFFRDFQGSASLSRGLLSILASKVGGAVLREIKHVLEVEVMPQSGSFIPQNILFWYPGARFWGLEVKLGTFSVPILTNPTFFVRNLQKNVRITDILQCQSLNIPTCMSQNYFFPFEQLRNQIRTSQNRIVLMEDLQIQSDGTQILQHPFFSIFFHSHLFTAKWWSHPI